MEKKSKLISDDGEEEGYPGYGKAIKLKRANETDNSICIITIMEEKENGNSIKSTGTGFFMNVKLEGKELNCLITNYHNITQDLVDNKKEIIIQIENESEKRIKLDINNRFIKCFKQPIDITIIEIKDEDDIKNEVSFLWYDKNYDLGYDNYFESDIFILQHPLGEETYLGTGKIMRIEKFEFEHSVETQSGSSGSPIILTSNGLVIGIHKQTNKINNNGIGTFIGEIFKKKDKNDENTEEKKNFL